MKIVYEIPDEAIELLKKIKNSGGAEFRDSEYENVEEFKKSSMYGTPLDGAKIRDEAYFFRRNFCNKDELNPLVKYNLIDCDGESWNLTYIVTEIGDEVLEQLEKPTEE